MQEFLQPAQETLAVQPEEVLTWSKVAYYSAGALVALVVALVKGRTIFRRVKKKWRERNV